MADDELYESFLATLLTLHLKRSYHNVILHDRAMRDAVSYQLEERLDEVYVPPSQWGAEGKRGCR